MPMSPKRARAVLSLSSNVNLSYIENVTWDPCGSNEAQKNLKRS